MIGSDMTNIISSLWSNIVRLFSQVHFPGTSYSIMGILVYTLISIVIIRILHKLFNSATSGYGKGGNNNRIKISNDRKGDAK